MKRILFIGGGRRVSLAKLFKERGYEVYAYETSTDVPISSVAKVIKGLKWTDEKILFELTSLIGNYKFDLVLPLMDEATLICSKLKEVISKDIFPVADTEPTETCLNKTKFDAYMTENFSDVYPAFKNQFPCILKPVKGFGSKDIHVCFNQIDIDKHYAYDWDSGEYVKQRCVQGVEYSVDAYFDKNSKYVDGIVRERTRVFDGEVISSRVEFKPELTDIVKTVGEKMKLKGPICAQFMIEDYSFKPYIFEINARFGGGVILSIAAGLEMIDYLAIEYLDWPHPLQPSSHKKYLKMERYFNEIFFEA